MPRRPQTFATMEIERCIKAARAAGLVIAEVVATATTIRIVTKDGTRVDDLDRELQEFEADHED